METDLAKEFKTLVINATHEQRMETYLTNECKTLIRKAMPVL
jgi:hypothetical protein